MTDIEIIINDTEAQRLKMVWCYNRHSTVEKEEMYKQWLEADAIFKQLIQKLKALQFNIAAQPQLQQHDVSRSALIQKYSDRLKVMKENRANEVDFMDDAESSSIDRQIQMVAEFISDLKSSGHFG